MSMSINSVNNMAKYNPSVYAKQNNKAAERMASSKRINSAADDAAGLAIAEKIQALINGLEQGSDNSSDMQNLLKTADGGLSTISDSLLRIRELGLQAQNGIYNDDDKALLQQEVNQMLEHIDHTASTTQFNNKNLLDGSAKDLHTASYADGGGMNVTIGSLSTASLGVSGFDVTGNIDLSKIDDAISQVSSARSNIGASVNRADYTIEYTQKAAATQAEAKSRIFDTDYAKESISYSTNRLLQQYRNFSLKNQMNSAGNLVNLLL